MTDDSVYIKNVLNGDKAAFSYLVDKYSDMVYSIAFKLLRSDVDAEDLAQDVFVEVYKSLAKFRGKSKFSTWVYRITYNKAITFLRKNRPEVSSNDEVFIENRGESEEQPGVFSETDSIDSVLQRAIKKLSDDEQMMLALHYFESQSIDEISKIMDMSSSNVKIKLFRSRKKLKAIIEQTGAEIYI
ncbi:MAG: RNA polymerase sigma factor [Prolixibacteraceae bacterium]|nr:RNA polymerase sigma factor [Prolixibacteraceae bacterium]